MAQAHTNKRDSIQPDSTVSYRQTPGFCPGVSSPGGHGAHPRNKSSAPNHLSPADNIYHPDFWSRQSNRCDKASQISKQVHINSALADMLMATH